MGGAFAWIAFIATAILRHVQSPSSSWDLLTPWAQNFRAATIATIAVAVVAVAAGHISRRLNPIRKRRTLIGLVLGYSFLAWVLLLSAKPA